ncbi:hypothetical protein Y032_0051g2090 [Ancylostoma ceylanicum]|uniref:Uncharacterized protein n=1 Tax=Ancylostoma ceylanicum TaxID=53326 RepID=A0A016U9E3_9BILA|nr:hypothetical protein Y032_0051g2090 [Ancylostoma ceylanicum]
MMIVCIFNACTLVSEASIEDLMMQAKKISYDVIGLTETRSYWPLNASGEKLSLGTREKRGIVGALVNPNLAMNFDLFKQLTTQIQPESGVRD